MNVEEYLTEFYKLDNIEKEILKIARETCTPILSLSKAKILSSIVSIKSPDLCLEIGLGIGFSTYSILKELKSNAKLISLDKNFHRIDIFYEKVYKKFSNNLKDKLEVFPLDAFYVFEIYNNINKKFDFIFIDSQKRDYYYFFPFLINLTKKGSIILIDNITYNFQTFKNITDRSENYKKGIELVKKFIKLISSSQYFSCSFIPAGDGMALLVRL